eukprot:TRINITY_DN23809_c0_g1_i1.p1 TRINITY_DN23809_c0_g1~~TRINITY_DN23809_c0_g1_i1.p1  ORF type:complete len:281 (-),score=62.62 TRINITY_DN23809_c0_g1_i1:138-938(-)
MCIRDRYQRRVRGFPRIAMSSSSSSVQWNASSLLGASPRSTARRDGQNDKHRTYEHSSIHNTQKPRPQICKSLLLTEWIPEGKPNPEHFEVVTSKLDVSELQEGHVLLQTMVFSADPYMRGQMKGNNAEPSYGPGEAVRGFVAGEVLESKHPGWAAGDLFGASLGFHTIQILSPEQLSQTLMWKLTGHISPSEISWGIGVLGMPGSTAYGGFLDVLDGKHSEGQTLWVSAAAGAVGSMVGQIAKNVYNCTVVGTCLLYTSPSPRDS